jgi:peptidyl-prolyl cis-trans isomerase A (cyclophilin A)
VSDQRSRRSGSSSCGERLALLAGLVFIGCGGFVATGAPDGETEQPSNQEDLFRVPEPEPVSDSPEVTDRVELVTSRGTIVIGLYGKAVPRTVENFLEYVDSGFYEGKIFHRVIPTFVVQGGGFDAELNRAETGEPIPLELIPGARHLPGTVSMARRPSEPDSATSQFFICLSEAPQLNGGYALFGEVEEGYDMVMDISSVPTATADAPGGEMEGVPVTPIEIEKARRLD